MSLSPLVPFKSRFVTYLLNFPRIIYPDCDICNYEQENWKDATWWTDGR